MEGAERFVREEVMARVGDACLGLAREVLRNVRTIDCRSFIATMYNALVPKTLKSLKIFRLIILP